MENNLQEEIKEIAKRFNVPEELVEVGLEARNATTMFEKAEAFKKEQALIEQGDSEAVKREHEKGKLTARERINGLVDPDSFEELDLFHRPYETGFEIGEERGRGDGVVVGYGLLAGKPLTVWAQDAAVMGGTMGTVHARKISMIMENGIHARTPIVEIYDSEGIRAHDAIHLPDFHSAGSIANFQTIASGVVPKISLVMGPCKGELAVVAGLSDFVFMVKGTSHMHLMPPSEGMSSEELGDAGNHFTTTGCCDVLAEDDEDCLSKCRKLLSFLPSHNKENPPVVNTGDDPNRREEELLEIVPLQSRKMFSMYKVISLIVDNGDFFEIKRGWAKNLITGFARLDGHTAGIVASNPQDRGGCMSLDAADKMSRFVRFCDAFNIPIVWLTDTPAFLPAVDEERRGLIRHGARMVMANSEATVPQVTVVLRKHYGGGRLAMPGQALNGDLSVAWPTHEPGLMGAEGAVDILYRRELASIEDEELRKQQRKARITEMNWGLDMMVREAAQKIIDPRDTRPFLIRALKWLRNKKQNLPPRKHENFRM